MFSDLGENDTVHDSLEYRHIGALDAKRGVEQASAQDATLINLANDALPNALPHGRDTDHEGGPEGADVTQTIAYGRVSESFDAPVAGGHAVERERDLHDEFQDMCQGEERKEIIR